MKGRKSLEMLVFSYATIAGPQHNLLLEKVQHFASPTSNIIVMLQIRR